MDIYALLQNNLGYFFLIFARISGIFSSAPIFAARNFPTVARLGFAFLLSYIIAPPILAQTNIAIPETIFPYLLLIASEYFIGVILGFVTYIVFYGIQMAGAILDIQIGFGMVHVLDPQLGQSIPLAGNFKYILAIIIFLATNCHHLFLSALFSSFTIVPLTKASSFSNLALILSDIVKNIYIIAIKIAFPVLISVFLTEVAVGIMAKTMPQLNIFVVGIPARIIAGLFMLVFALPFYVIFLEVLFTGMFNDIYRVLGHLGRL